MVKKAEANFPHLDQPEAIQKQADMGPGKEAPTGAGESDSPANQGKETSIAVLSVFA